MVGDDDAVRVLHEQTKHGHVHDRSRLVRFRPLDPANRPVPFKGYKGLETVPLPRDVGVSETPATAVLSGQTRIEPAVLNAHLLARLLFHSAGVTRVSRSRSGGETTWFRAAMSAGNLHPVEVYVVCRGLAGLDGGVYHVAPFEFGLTRLRAGDVGAGLTGAPAALVLTGISWRTGWKYGERGYRHLWWDAGAMAANLLAVAEAAGVEARVRLGFDDAALAKLVGVDATAELPLALIELGTVPEGEGAEVEVPPLEVEVEPISVRPLTFPLVVAAHRAGDLSGPEEVTAWRRAAAAFAGDPAVVALDPPSGRGAGDDQSVEAVIGRRGSTRLMRRETVTGEAITWGMAVAGRVMPWDASAPGTTLVEHYLSVHAVEGLEPGAYRWRPGRLERQHHGDLRDLAEHLCLDQPLGGDSAFTAFYCASLEHVLGGLGPRGYRAAQFEAGVAAGRLQLAAFTLGLGATGLTFFDDEVSKAFATDAACLLVTSVGLPAYRSVPGGRPGEPAELARFDTLMARLEVRLRGR